MIENLGEVFQDLFSQKNLSQNVVTVTETMYLTDVSF